MAHISDIKLIRIDTTLDLSQKVEKGMSWEGGLSRAIWEVRWLRASWLGEVGLNVLRSSARPSARVIGGLKPKACFKVSL
jgi:hypothetical protein